MIKLKEISFDQLPAYAECLFRTEQGYIVHATKIGVERIRNRVTGEMSYTGQYHKVLQVEDTFFKPTKEIKVQFKYRVKRYLRNKGFIT